MQRFRPNPDTRSVFRSWCPGLAQARSPTPVTGSPCLITEFLQPRLALPGPTLQSDSPCLTVAVMVIPRIRRVSYGVSKEISENAPNPPENAETSTISWRYSLGQSARFGREVSRIRKKDAVAPCRVCSLGVCSVGPPATNATGVTAVPGRRRWVRMGVRPSSWRTPSTRGGRRIRIRRPAIRFRSGCRANRSRTRSRWCHRTEAG